MKHILLLPSMALLLLCVLSSCAPYAGGYAGRPGYVRPGYGYGYRAVPNRSPSYYSHNRHAPRYSPSRHHHSHRQPSYYRSTSSRSNDRRWDNDRRHDRRGSDRHYRSRGPGNVRSSNFLRL